MPKKEYLERDITLVGRTKPSEEGDEKSCEVCTEANEFLTTAAKHDNRIRYQKIEIDTPEGQEIAEKQDIRDIPYIKDCRTFEKGKPARCREIEGWSVEDDWSDLDDLIEADKDKAKVEEAKKEEEPKAETKTGPIVDKETGIVEPQEPEEPK